MIPNINKELVIAASQETCFYVFTQKMDSWWPRDYHVGSCPMREMMLEAKPEGRWYTLHEDGSEVNVGKVLTWSPYDLLVLNWQIDANFQYDPAVTTEVEVQFIPEGLGVTRVTLEHKDLDRLGEGGKSIDSMDEGWGFIMNLYKGVTEVES